MVERVGEDDTRREGSTEGAKSGIVGDVAGGENECRFFSVKLREFTFEREVKGTVACDVAGSSSSGTVLVKSTAGRLKKGKRRCE